MRNAITVRIGTAILSAALLARPAVAEELTDAKEILKRADEACRKVESASYSVKARSSGWLESRAPSAEGEVVLAGKSKTPQDSGKFRVTVRTTPQGASEPVELTGGSNGETCFLIDPAGKTVYEDIDPAVMGRNARLIQGLIVRAFVSEEPFADELKSEVELTGAESVNGEDCYQVGVKSEAQGESVWFIAKKDFLPRRRDRVLVNPAGEKATREVVLSNLVVNAPMAGEPFKAVVPEGFKKTDDFAP